MPCVQSRDHGFSQLICTVFKTTCPRALSEGEEGWEGILEAGLNPVAYREEKERATETESFSLLLHELNDPQLDKSKHLFFFFLSDKLGIICIAQKFWRIRVKYG